jgi:diguanylate cyclase (GGDEF)-like protein
MEALTCDASRPVEPAELLRVLVVDDENDCRASLECAVRSLGHSCSTARDGVEAWEKYEADRADVILADWNMPRMDGLDLCHRVRGDDRGRPYTHFIFVTGNDDKAHFIRGMRAGADDYLAKPVDLDELEARLEAARRSVMLHRELRRRNSFLRDDRERAYLEARRDPLTQAFNRLALEEDLADIAARASREGHPYCAALCDVDEFKAYNDHFGHLPGDDVLRRIARAIHGELRRGDAVYRYGGDELLVLLPEPSLAAAALALDRMRRAVERLGIRHAPAAGLPVVTMSVGISTTSAAPGETTDDWVRRADAALYAAKSQGRNCVLVEGAARRAGGA